MISRERIIATVEGRPTDRPPFVIHWGPWKDTRERWLREGMEREDDWRGLFDFDLFHRRTPVNFGICPPFKREVLADEGDAVVFRDGHGVVKRDFKTSTSMPQFLEYPVRDRETWAAHKWRFDPETPERFPEDWPQRAEELKSSEALIWVATYPYGFFGGLRTLMGAERCLTALALEPGLIEDINEHFCSLWCSLWDRVMQETRVDEIHFWEDMAGKSGSLISPRMFRRFLTPYYKRLIALGRKHGVRVFSVDSDGLMDELSGLFVEAGANTIFPYEVQAGNDIPSLLDEYPGLCAQGGMDKRAMARGKKAIDEEIERVSCILEMGRYIPFPDHLIPSDVSWENYCYFVRRWKEMVGKE